MRRMSELPYVTHSMACGEEYRYALAGERLSTSTDIRDDYRGGYYFSASTLEWFGSEGFTTVAPGASVELQSNAPTPQYRAEVWREGENGPEPWFGCYHGSRAQAEQCAKATAAKLA